MPADQGLAAICVYCGSSNGRDPAYVAAARIMGGLIAASGRTLVYGGATVGTMGVVADAALAAGGEVHGVLTQHLVDVEIAHRGLTRLDVVASMHERKARLAELSDAFLALPGGLGTLEELFEMLTWSQLGLHRKPVGLLDVAGFWAQLLGFLDRCVDDGFVRPEHRRILLSHADPETLIELLEQWQPPTTGKWLDR